MHFGNSSIHIRLACEDEEQVPEAIEVVHHGPWYLRVCNREDCSFGPPTRRPRRVQRRGRRASRRNDEASKLWESRLDPINRLLERGRGFGPGQFTRDSVRDDSAEIEET